MEWLEPTLAHPFATLPVNLSSPILCYSSDALPSLGISPRPEIPQFLMGTEEVTGPHYLNQQLLLKYQIAPVVFPLFLRNNLLLL